jgi:hypothetical protein
MSNSRLRYCRTTSPISSSGVGSPSASVKNIASDRPSAPNSFSTGSKFSVVKTSLWRNDALFQPEPRVLVRELLKLGYTDAFRSLHPNEGGQFTLWNYFQQAFEHNRGIRTRREKPLRFSESTEGKCSVQTHGHVFLLPCEGSVRANWMSPGRGLSHPSGSSLLSNGIVEALLHSCQVGGAI